MHGVITLREVIGNAGLVVREFGPLCLVRCVWASLGRHPTTFLAVACRLRAR